MNIFSIIKYDYLQRTRSYTFLITLCVSIAISYTFIPSPNANYSTIRVAGYIGYYNAAWFGYVTTVMSCTFLCLIGFYLVNGSIKKDLDTKIGQIIASSRIQNFQYLLSKTCSNFLILVTILTVLFLMNILLFFAYNDGYSFEFIPFIKPYALITIPALFFISVLATIFEVFLYKSSVVQNIGFFFLFSMLMMPTNGKQENFSFDILGTQIVMHQTEKQVREITNGDKIEALSVGYVIGNVSKAKKFQFTGVTFPNSFIFSRCILILISVLLLYISAIFFHRFSIKIAQNTSQKKRITIEKLKIKDINISKLAKLNVNFSIFPLIKTELLLLIRKGNKWLWLLNGIGMLLLAIVPLEIAHQIVLPILWFLQVNRLSELTTKEITNKVHYFSFSSFNPIRRLLTSQIIACIVLITLLAMPLIFRFVFTGNILPIISILQGGFFITLLAAFLGITTKGKKLFEVLFFMITYANVHKLPFTDYFGAINNSISYTFTLFVLVTTLALSVLSIRRYQLKKV